jgi:hypothetical protein
MEELLAVVRAQHFDGPRIDALLLDSRKNAVVPKGGEGASVKGDWIRSSRCCFPWHGCWASGLKRFVGEGRRNRQCDRYGSKTAVPALSPDVGLSPDSGGIADIPQPAPGANSGLVLVSIQVEPVTGNLRESRDRDVAVI